MGELNSNGSQPGASGKDGEMENIEITVWFPKEKRLMRFHNPHMCGEYDTLSFDLVDDDKDGTYKWLAGESFIPDSEFEIINIKGDQNL